MGVLEHLVMLGSFVVPMEASVPSWVVEAARLPVAFAQVREDSEIDLWVVKQIGAEARIIMVASGGCTAAALAGSGGVSTLHLVDPNPAQLALTRLKLWLLENVGTVERLELLGHAPLDASRRKAQLAEATQAAGLLPDSLAPQAAVAVFGPDHCGRYEHVFAQLRRQLEPQAEQLHDLLRLRDPVKQAQRVAPAACLGQALDTVFDEVMAQPHLVRLFGEGATQNRCVSFARHFAERTRRVLATQPAADNPYLWQMLRGYFPAGKMYPWLTAPRPGRMPEIHWSAGDMASALEGTAGGFDFVHLSNILDWLSPSQASRLLALSWTALRPGGWLLIRQLNSTLDIRASGPQFDWLIAEADALHLRDRSFFYRALHLGRKP